MNKKGQEIEIFFFIIWFIVMSLIAGCTITNMEYSFREAQLSCYNICDINDGKYYDYNNGICLCKINGKIESITTG